MKRKFKLFATVASLCLCLALMAFGVYAASTATYSVNGSVTFTTKEVFVEAKTTVYKAVSTANKVVASPATLSDGDWSEAVATDTRDTVDANNNFEAFTAYSITNALDFNVSGVYKVVIVLNNLSDEDGITVNDHACDGKNLVNAAIAEASGNSSVATIAKSGTATLTYYITLSNSAKKASGTWSISIGMEKQSD